MKPDREPWFVFIHPDGRELCAMTVRGTFDGEIEDTLELLAYEHGISPTSITVAEIVR